MRIADGAVFSGRILNAGGLAVDVAKGTLEVDRTASIASLTVRQGDTGTFSVEATGGNLSYQWYATAAGASDQAISGGRTARYGMTSAASRPADHTHSHRIR